MNKNRHIIGELQEFFANNDASKAINSISTIMNSIRIQSKVIGSVKNPNCKLFACDKDMFYRFMNDGNVNWRRIIYSVFRQLYSRVSRRRLVCHYKHLDLRIDLPVSDMIEDLMFSQDIYIIVNRLVKMEILSVYPDLHEDTSTVGSSDPPVGKTQLQKAHLRSVSPAGALAYMVLPLSWHRQQHSSPSALHHC